MLELDDIQHILVTRTPALTGRYEFLTFRGAGGGRAWLAGILGQGAIGRGGRRHRWTSDKRWVTVAFTWNGLRALGVDEASLATFPEEFKQGMVARAEILGDTGANIRTTGWVTWPAPTSTPSSSCSPATPPSTSGAWRSTRSSSRGVRAWRVLSSLDLEATPPFDYAHDHFGYRDRLSQPVIERHRRGADSRLRRAAQARRVHPRLSGRGRSAANLPQPEILSRNGTYMAYRRLEEHVGTFRDFLRQHGKTAEEQEFIAAKLMGRWRSGAPWCSRRRRTTRRSARTCSATTTSTTRRWTRSATRCRSARTAAA